MKLPLRPYKERREKARRIARLIHKKKGLLLDISLGGEPQAKSLTMGELECDPLKGSFPLPDQCVNTAVITHVLEYLDPSEIFDWFDELHRVMMPKGIAYFSGPYGGDESQGWLSDPTHRLRIVEATFVWLDPRSPYYTGHDTVGRKTPKPWIVLANARVPGTGTLSYNVTLQRADPQKTKK